MSRVQGLVVLKISNRRTKSLILKGFIPLSLHFEHYQSCSLAAMVDKGEVY